MQPEIKVGLMENEYQYYRVGDLIKNKWFRIIFVVWILTFVFYMGCVNYIEPTQAGIARNQINGTMWLQDAGGFHFTWPWVLVTRIDIAPIRVSVISAGKGYSSKLIQFQPEYWREFVQVEGWHYYWWYNRLSYNYGYTEEYRGFRDIMRGHAFGAKKYSFIKMYAEYEQK